MPAGEGPRGRRGCTCAGGVSGAPSSIPPGGCGPDGWAGHGARAPTPGLFSLSGSGGPGVCGQAPNPVVRGWSRVSKHRGLFPRGAGLQHPGGEDGVLKAQAWPEGSAVPAGQGSRGGWCFSSLQSPRASPSGGPQAGSPLGSVPWEFPRQSPPWVQSNRFPGRAHSGISPRGSPGRGLLWG